MTPDARLQPQAARIGRMEHDAWIEGAPTVGCEPWLDGTPGCESLEPRNVTQVGQGSRETAPGGCGTRVNAPDDCDWCVVQIHAR